MTEPYVRKEYPLSEQTSRIIAAAEAAERPLTALISELSDIQRSQRFKELPMTEPYVRKEYPLSEQTSRIIAAAKAVHAELGPGFEEVIYQRALALEFPVHGLDFSREVWMDVYYRGTKVGRKRVDFVVEDVMVEIKAKAALDDVDFVQTLSYLKASGYTVALLLNFGAKQLQIKRIINERPR
jgi:GxxExxY protein